MGKNAFHQMAYTDPHQALSFDRLHLSHTGLFGDHLLLQIKQHIESLGHHAIKSVDDQLVIFQPVPFHALLIWHTFRMDEIPHWRGLNHFGAIMHVSFTDGSKYEDISKVSISCTSEFLPPLNGV